MGLRPSVKSEESGSAFNKSTASLKSQNETNAPSNNNNNGKISSSSSSGSGNSSTSSSSTPPLPPQREAWTARGQMLLNFHDAISRAINSPEMARKCNQIAEDMSMSRSEEENSSINANANTNNNISSGGQLRSNKSTTATITEHKHKPHSVSVAEEYSAEAALIVENKSKRDAAVRNKAVALGLFSFVALRSGRGLSSWMRKTIANRAGAGAGAGSGAGAGGSYRFDKMPGTGISSKSSSLSLASTTATASAKSSVESNVHVALAVNQPSLLRRFFRLTFDVTISTSITLLSGTFLFMPRPSAYIEDMSKLPLVEGKSIYAEMVCPALLKEYRRVLEQYGGHWPVRGSGIPGSNGNWTARAGDNGSGSGSRAVPELTQEDVSLNVIRTFVENCSKRSKYERALFEERNALSKSLDNTTAVSRLMRRMTRNREAKDKSESRSEDLNNQKLDKLGTVSVPSPGVPGDISVNIDQDVFSIVGEDGYDAGEDSKV